MRSECVTTGTNSTTESEFVQRWTPNRPKRDAGGRDRGKTWNDDVARQKCREEGLLWRVNQLRQRQVAANGARFRIMLFLGRLFV